ncbi:recombinase zinc beta ribbon domain-containing protein [Umezawaea beigongshangensis]|uniref:recombinase zinc beta ribbon domain-containing protein n=1 Tax=Umezawaea beigongshangensis TaxID=2780383 RepID=UPI0018F1715A|nr:recombinase zinc beta ribbon domain-containing protein [Umezawaea beigongshangensis]
MLRGLLLCGLCGRRMQGQFSGKGLYCRCRFAQEYGLVNKVEHPRNVYLAERDLLGPLDDWLALVFAPHRLSDTVDALYRSQPDLEEDPATLDARRVVAECDRKLERHRAALEAGTDPRLVARWTAEVSARRAEALSRSRAAVGRERMTREQIATMVAALGDVRQVLGNADPDDEAEVYRQLRLSATYHPGKRTVRVETSLDPHSWGCGACPRGDLRTIHTPQPVNHFQPGGGGLET